MFGTQLFVPETRFVDELRQPCQKVAGSRGGKATSNTGRKKAIQFGSLPPMVTKSSTTLQDEQAHDDDFVAENPSNTNALQTGGDDKLLGSLKYVQSLMPRTKKSSDRKLATANARRSIDGINLTGKGRVQNEELWDSGDILPLDETQSLKSNSIEPIQTKYEGDGRFQSKTNLPQQVYYDGILDTTQRSTLS